MTNYTIIQNDTITSYLSDKGFRLYTLLQSMCYANKITCYPSQKYLATALRCSVRTIQRTLLELKKFNLISIRRRGSISNIYTLLQKKISNTIEKVKDVIKGSKKPYKAKKTSFNSYQQRNYDFNKLEELLLYGQGDYNSCLKE